MVTLQYFITNYMIHVLDTKDVLSILKKKSILDLSFFIFNINLSTIN